MVGKRVFAYIGRVLDNLARKAYSREIADIDSKPFGSRNSTDIAARRAFQQEVDVLDSAESERLYDGNRHIHDSHSMES